MHQNVQRFALPIGSVALLTSAICFGVAREEVTTIPVAGNVSIFSSSRSGNIGFQTGPDGALMIDDKFDTDIADVEAAMKALSERAPTFLVNTHHHDDHTGANPHFGKASTIVAHSNVRVRLVGGGKPAEAFPVITYDDGMSIWFNGEEVRLIHAPNAHTDGDTVVWFKGSNVVHMGDLYFQTGYPYIDTGAGGSATGLIAGIESILALVPDDVRIIPGHGEPTGVAGMREYLTMLKTIQERISELHGEGFTVEEILEAGATEEFDERWGGGFIDRRRMVESVVAGLE